MSINHGQRTGINVDTMETQLPTDLTLIQSTKYSYMRFVKAAVIDIGCRPDESPASWEQIQATAQVIMQYDAKCRAEIHCPLLKDEPLPPKLNAEEATKIDVNCLMRTTMSMCHYKAMLFLYRPSLRRLIGRLRARATNEAVVFDEKDKETVSMTYYACHAITACSRYLIRTVSSVYPCRLSPYCILLARVPSGRDMLTHSVASPLVRSILGCMGPSAIRSRLPCGTGNLVWTTSRVDVYCLGVQRADARRRGGQRARFET